ncbi:MULTISPECIES: c-type cytochrome biogenesis protein CcmI [unclassified Hyphomicrobium]|uniref:c-type cytochrome biogenesis protein CcmI n=1 Tax=unclassified Hyphomicrobium TaxID=2619925 RepID=UPI000213F6B6|nr:MULTISPECIES: c-type cytochrome biogenesis protein CcmI [unclassified Hyphomicrobium]CCB65588.1 Cytochrome c-type biogenesis protein CycH [Hyphomicrobium sp. MC1]
MVFWILVAVLVAGVTLAIVRPLMRPAEPAGATAGADVAVYKDQLKEITADEARGTLGADEAESARAEIARRLLRVTQDNSKSTTAAEAAMRNRFIVPISILTCIALPIVSLALYLDYGKPGMPAQPLSERLAEANATSTPNDLIAKVEQRLREHPEDGRGWDVIAPVYYAMGRYADAADAYQKAIRLIGEDPKRLQGFANARIRMENGIVPDDARKALQRILVLNPNATEPKIWLALAKEQDGHLTEAAADYKDLISKAPPDAPWRPVLVERLAKLDPQSAAAFANDKSTANAPAAASGMPSGPEAGAVMNMKPEDRQAFITQMVDNLAARLKTDGSDANGWVKLIRAYQVLGRHDDAVKALNDARVSLKGNQGGLAQVEDLARQLGLGS